MSDLFTLHEGGLITEKLLHYIWRFQYFNRTQLLSSDGEKVEVVFPGIINYNQGPDFKGAKIRIGTTLFAGSVELHLKTSDWHKHGHQGDSNYGNVILHVVYQHDADPGNNIPVLELEPHISGILLNKYQFLMNASAFIPCSNTIAQVPGITWLSWKERLLAERLERKAVIIISFLKENNTHWEEAFWWLLARNFGSKVNVEAFEAIARSIPINILAKQKAQIHQLEGLLLGQANLLQKDFSEEYPKLLKREYEFLKKKYHLVPISIPVHFLRMRPRNFPTIRLAQLAMLVHTSVHLFSKFLETENMKDVTNSLYVTANDYWHYHYLLDEPASFKKKTIGAGMIENIIINTVAPALFAYGLYHKEEKYKTKAIQWMEQLPAEKNSIIGGFAALKISSKKACDSQALLELKNEYCSNKRCLECSVGNYYLKSITSSTPHAL
ncbi:DUF2851 family protein [Chitinophagaceae bacterium LB-8]|uniref:DUF2851 family protein n=1 Tax=Paraflavisolibacter caeni TaxID=2982496 RepID=A0A9X3BIK3_9BACT|nr:DUF2851 family protein [Paraflavisolibacter caeni]MCU7551527.1 DUF2851 family protein [Paraflavisolibacter caeni]